MNQNGRTDGRARAINWSNLHINGIYTPWAFYGWHDMLSLLKFYVKILTMKITKTSGSKSIRQTTSIYIPNWRAKFVLVVCRKLGQSMQCAPFGTWFSEPRVFWSSVETRPRQCGATVSGSSSHQSSLFHSHTHTKQAHKAEEERSIFIQRHLISSQVMCFSSYSLWKNSDFLLRSHFSGGSQPLLPVATHTHTHTLTHRDLTMTAKECRRNKPNYERDIFFQCNVQ